MAKKLMNGIRQGPNSLAVERLVAQLEEEGLRKPFLEPAIEIARSLAAQVDIDGTSSQLWMRYQAAEGDLRDKLRSLEDSKLVELQWGLHTGCSIRADHAVANDAHCSKCCRVVNGWDDVESFESIHIRGDGEIEKARGYIYLFLQRQP